MSDCGCDPPAAVANDSHDEVPSTTENTENNVVEEQHETNALLCENGTGNEGSHRNVEVIQTTKISNGNENLSKNKEEDAAVLVLPPDGGWGWVIVAASFVCNFVVDGIIFSFGVNLEDMVRDLQVSKPQVALVGSLLSGFYLLAGPFVSAVANKFGFRIVTIAGALLAAAGVYLSTLVDSIALICFFFGVIGGVGLGLIYSPSILIVGFYFERWRALATGVAVCGSGIGTMIIAPLTDMVVKSYGWRFAFRIHAGMILLCAICGIFFRPLPPVQVTLEPEESYDNSRKSIKKNKKKGELPTAADILQLSKSTQSLTPSIIMNRVAALSGQTQSVPMIPVKGRKRTASENSSIGGRSRRGTVTDVIIRSRRGTITKIEDTNIANRPLYRDDIFYSGSLHRLPDYNSSQRDFMGYTLSVTRLPTKDDFEDDEECCKFGTIKGALNILFDTSLLKSPSFLIICFSGFLTLMGIFTPFTYLPSRQTDAGMSPDDVAWLLSVVGVTNTIGRVVCGLASSAPCVDALFITNVALTLGGIATMISDLDNSAGYQYTYCAIFGFTLACFASLRSILVVDLFGIGKLTNAFGILLLFQGLAAVCGSPLSGLIMTMTGSYNHSFILAGTFILLSGVICYPLKIIVSWENKRKSEKHDEAFA